MKVVQSMIMAVTFLAGTSAIAQTVSPTQFVAKAGASDKFEIASAKLETSSSNSAIAQFAQQMITDHSKSTAMVKAAATADKLAPKPPVLTAKQNADLAALGRVKGQARDALYVQQQKTAHADALQLMQDYSANGTATNLKSAAGQIAPVVQQHVTMLQSM
jgi:putative membrane protein